MKKKNNVIEFEIVRTNEVMDLNIKGSMKNKGIRNCYESFIKKFNESKVVSNYGFELSWKGYSIMVLRLSEEVYFSLITPDDDLTNIKCYCYYSNKRFKMLQMSMNLLEGDFLPVQMLSIFFSKNSLDKYECFHPAMKNDEIQIQLEYLMKLDFEEYCNSGLLPDFESRYPHSWMFDTCGK